MIEFVFTKEESEDKVVVHLVVRSIASSVINRNFSIPLTSCKSSSFLIPILYPSCAFLLLLYSKAFQPSHHRIIKLPMLPAKPSQVTADTLEDREAQGKKTHP
jgi:hypothetical protein